MKPCDRFSTLAIVGTCMFLFSSLLVQVHGCTLILVGRNATIDGSTIVAHNDDAGGSTADLRLVRVPRKSHPPNALRSVYNFDQGYPRVVTMERGVHYEPKNDQQVMKPLLQIPQVPMTYAYFDQDYGMMNEVQLSIGESTCSAKTVGWPSDLPYGFNAFGIAELSKLALERCDSARCAIRLMGDMAVKHGFYSEDSGSPLRPGYDDSAEALGIADKYGENWIFHVLTGADNSSAIWAAQRVPDDHISVVANGFIIRQMNLDDPDNFMASENVEGLALKMGWWKPEDGPFDFTAAYGYLADPAKTSPLYSLYVGRRVWRVLDVFAPSLKLDSTLGFLPNKQTYPVSVKPDAKIHPRDIMNILRDHYEGTPYDMTKGIAAGPFGNPVRYDGWNKGVKGGWERAISMFRTMYSIVLQARSDLPDAVGGVTWYAQDSPHGSVYVPFSCAQEDVPKSYLDGCESKFDPTSAWWAFNFVNNWSLLRYDIIHQDVQSEINRLQDKAFEVQTSARNEGLALKDNPTEMVRHVKTTYNNFADQVVKDWWALAWTLVAKFSDGFVVTGEGASDMKSPGYPKWWLEATDFSQWPGASFTFPEPMMASQSFAKSVSHAWIYTAGIFVLALASVVLTRRMRRSHGYRML